MFRSIHLSTKTPKQFQGKRQYFQLLVLGQLDIHIQKNFLFLFTAAPMACGSSQSRGQIGAAIASLHHSHSNISQAAFVTYTTAHGNATSLIHS